MVLVVIIFELLQSRHQGIPTAFGNSDREHDEEGIEATFLDNHTMLGQILGHNSRRNTDVFRERTIDIQPWRNDGGFDRVQHIEAIGPRHIVPLVAAPAPRILIPEVLIGLSSLLV